MSLALQADGWWWRSICIWHKPNSFVNPVKDRPTVDFEPVFLFAKSEDYYWDYEAVKERCVGPQKPSGPRSRMNIDRDPDHGTRTADAIRDGSRLNGNERAKDDEWRNMRSVWSIASASAPDWEFCGACRRYFKGTDRKLIVVGDDENGQTIMTCVCGKTDGWVGHFAAYPEKLLHKLVLAGCPEDGIILDPFMGSGTSALVALKARRRFIGVELNPDYAEISRHRIAEEMAQARLF